MWPMVKWKDAFKFCCSDGRFDLCSWCLGHRTHHKFTLGKALLRDSIVDTSFMTPLLCGFLSLPSQLPVFRRALLSWDYLQNRHKGEIVMITSMWTRRGEHKSSNEDEWLLRWSIIKGINLTINWHDNQVRLELNLNLCSFIAQHDSIIATLF